MEPESIDDFENELRQSLERRPAPPGFKRRLIERRSGRRTQQQRGHAVLWQRLAASVALACVLGGGLAWRHQQEQRQGEAARQQVLTALRVTSHALNKVNERLTSHGRADQE